MGMQPQVTPHDNNPSWMQPLQGQQNQFLQGVFQGQNPFGTGDLQRQATGGMQQFLNQPAPESRALGAAAPALENIINSSSAAGMTQAFLPGHQQNLSQAMGQLQNAAPGRFSSAFAGQGIDLGRQAAQDFNLFQQQALQNQQQNAMGAAGMLGQLSQAAGDAPFQRFMQAGQFAQNPMLQLLMGGLQYGAPKGVDAIVGKSPFEMFMDTLMGGAGMYMGAKALG